MERSITFTEGEFYHIYNRGVDKRKIFFSKGDWLHFQHLLFLRNSERHIKPARVLGFPWDTIDRGEQLADICAYAMMPNHFHLLVREKQEGGISKFMGKLSTSYAMYMNKKYDRSGPLMCRPFRAKHVDSDEYFRWVLAYIHTNPVELFDSRWKEERSVRNVCEAETFLRSYQFSSYFDYFVKERNESRILNKEALPILSGDLEKFESLASVLGEP